MFFLQIARLEQPELLKTAGAAGYGLANGFWLDWG
jgi:hypothetical protein